MRYLALVRLHPITVYRSGLGCALFWCWMPLFGFFANDTTTSVLVHHYSYWNVHFYSFYITDLDFLKLGDIGSAIPHFLGCFFLWAFFKNIGLNMLPLDPFVSNAYSKLGYSIGEFQLSFIREAWFLTGLRVLLITYFVMGSDFTVDRSKGTSNCTTRCGHQHH